MFPVLLRRTPWARLAPTLAILAMSAAVPVSAADAQQTPQPPSGPSVQAPRPLVPPATTTAPRPATRPPSLLRIDARVCRRLVDHIADPDVTYQPGVDVRGRRVVPADATDWSQFEAMVPDTVTFHIALDPLEAADLPTPPGIETPEVALGTVTYDLVRNLFVIDGRPLITSQQDALAWACRQGLSGRVRPGRVITPPGYRGPPLPAPKPSP